MMQREIHVICDKCGAEGPSVVGEKRPQLLQEIFKLGWKLVEGMHVCMECIKTAKHLPVEVKAPTVTVKGNEDRSTHWTEARKRSE